MITSMALKLFPTCLRIEIHEVWQELEEVWRVRDEEDWVERLLKVHDAPDANTEQADRHQEHQHLHSSRHHKERLFLIRYTEAN